ncbi:DNA primase [Aggregicoccus sp. 17bor-14]|uniref:DNA primase n=1 Tax=Myxococcaceae TaxID=31 RepID=UPI00129C3B38|nr:MULTISPECIES: DNA primase [Myxococcaceae]MBF5040988.1 DNA primase [Simulacricoccus sp. 17bor-14]MRI86775.1 DNA primase [Aggregicoccus sp. 17bor-14]
MAPRSFSPQTLEELRRRVDLVGLVARHVELKPSGREFRGLCPFHEERTPSFYVVPLKGFYFCHGCRARGDAVDFVQRVLGRSFVEAVQELASEVGLALEQPAGPVLEERQRLREVTQAAHEHFQALLWGEEGAEARAYLEGRGITAETAQLFGLGWAPAGWDRLAGRLARTAQTEAGVAAGLLQPRARGGGCFDFFRSRVVVPIRTLDGRTVGFGGRLVGSAEGPEYLNSKESALFHKGDLLFGMDRAREEVRRLRRAVLVEGYFDCLALHQVGVRNAVALCSTHLAPGHLQALARAEARELVLLLDGDAAGLAAVERLAGTLLAAGASAQVAQLPAGEDPDTFALREGEAGVRRLLAEARPLTLHLFSTVLPEGREATFEAKMLALGRLRGVAAQLPEGLTRSAFFEALAAHVGLPAAQLEAASATAASRAAGAAGTAAASSAAAASAAADSPGAAAAPGAPPPAPTAERSVDALEAHVVACVLRAPELRAHDAFGALGHLSEAGLRAALHVAADPGSSVSATGAVARALARASRALPADEEALGESFRAACLELTLRRVDGALEALAQALVGAGAGESLALQSQRTELLALRRRVASARALQEG